MNQQDENTILAVNDDHDQLEFMCFLLKQSGYNVLAASEGSEAFRIAQGAHPWLIMSDVMMPQVNGIQLYANQELKNTDIENKELTAFGFVTATKMASISG